MNWNDVLKVRRTDAAVLIKEGRIESIIAGSQRHSDVRVGGEILYQVPLRPYYKRMVAALERAEKENLVFDVYWKWKPNDWENVGKHRVKSSTKTSALATFVLKAAPE